MTFQEAIKDLTRFVNAPYSQLDPYFTEAIKLGIEALKRVEDMRISPCTTADEILPGETKE